jgi:hypothetical protein
MVPGFGGGGMVRSRSNRDSLIYKGSSSLSFASVCELTKPHRNRKVIKKILFKFN